MKHVALPSVRGSRRRRDRESERAREGEKRERGRVEVGDLDSGRERDVCRCIYT